MGSVGGWRGAGGGGGVWAHIESLQTRQKDWQGRPGKGGGGGVGGGGGGGGGGGEGGGGLGTHWKPLNTSKTLARAARWRRRRVGGQSADGGGDGEGLER